MIPPENEWITVEEVARRAKRSVKTINEIRTHGRLNASRTKRVKMKFWRSYAGYVTTQQSLREYNEDLNS